MKSTEFKTVKNEQLKNGYIFLGAEYIEVIYNISKDIMMVGVPFIAADGTVKMEVFFNGIHQDLPSKEEEESVNEIVN